MIQCSNTSVKVKTFIMHFDDEVFKDGQMLEAQQYYSTSGNKLPKTTNAAKMC